MAIIFSRIRDKVLAENLNLGVPNVWTGPEQISNNPGGGAGWQ